MNQQDFEHSVEKQIMKCKRLLDRKGKYYHSAGADRLRQFKIAAKLQHTTQESALSGMMCKHTTKLYDMIEFGNGQKKDFDEVITDHINFLFLLNAVLEEGVHETLP